MHVDYQTLGFISSYFSSKTWLMCSLVASIFLYTCESWTLTAELERRMQAMDMRVLPQGTTHLIQRPCYQRGSTCQDPAGKWTTRRPPSDRKKTQTAVVWSCLPFIRSSENHLASHSERGKKTRQAEEEVGRQHQGMDRPEVRQVPESSGEQGKMKKLVVKSPVLAQWPSPIENWWWWWWRYRILSLTCIMLQASFVQKRVGTDLCNHTQPCARMHACTYVRTHRHKLHTRINAEWFQEFCLFH